MLIIPAESREVLLKFMCTTTLNFAPQIFPKQKDAEFDAEGRPYNPFFYTAAPQTTTLLHDIATHIEQVGFCEQCFGAGLESKCQANAKQKHYQ